MVKAFAAIENGDQTGLQTLAACHHPARAWSSSAFRSTNTRLLASEALCRWPEKYAAHGRVEGAHDVLGGPLYGSTFYTMTGFHGAHVTDRRALPDLHRVQGVPRQVHASQPRRRRDHGPVLALRRPGLDHPVHDRLPRVEREDHGDIARGSTKSAELYTDLGHSAASSRLPRWGSRSAEHAEIFLIVALLILAALEGAAGRAVLHAPEVRAEEVVDDRRCHRSR